MPSDVGPYQILFIALASAWVKQEAALFVPPADAQRIEVSVVGSYLHAEGSLMYPSGWPVSTLSHAAFAAAVTAASLSPAIGPPRSCCMTTGGHIPVRPLSRLIAGAPERTPSKSSGWRCTSM